MARTNLDAWIPVEKGDNVLLQVTKVSAIETLSRIEPMGSDTKDVPRNGDVTGAVTPKGSAYTEAGGTDDVVTLRARKFTGLLRIADEDLQDAPANIIAAKQAGWLNWYASALDNAALGVYTAPAGDGSNQATVPFQSVYAAIVAAGLATTNRIATAAGTAPSYANLSATFSAVEGGNYGDNLVVIAHPSFKNTFRQMVDGGGNLVFQPGGGAQMADTLFGSPVIWTQGARGSAAYTATPTGNPLLFVVNRDLLILGRRSGPEFAAVNGFTGAGALTDEALIKARSRRGFVFGQASGAAVLEAVRTGATAGA